VPTLGTGSSRRALLRAAPAVAAKESYRPAHWKGARLLSAADRHLVGRFSTGVTPALTAEVRRAGGGREWFERQLSPGRVGDAAADELAAWWPSLGLGARELWRRQEQEIEGGWQVMESYQSWLLLRRIRTRRHVQELMTGFWLDHLNVPVNGDAAFTWRFDYDRQVRARALGSFRDILHAAVTHPAMGIYLDNAVSTKRQPNENLGRELLELHTVGRGQYTEDDVKSSARILTGWRVDLWRTWSAEYSPEDHWVGPVRVMGFQHPNASPDGRAVTRAYLDHLARHPATAQRIARRLAVKFVGDRPPEALVARLAKVYRDHDTQIRPVLRALVASTAFKESRNAKVRDPIEDVVATYRALGVRIGRPAAGDDGHASRAVLWQCSAVGADPHGWPRPDGPPLDNESWSTPARMLASMDVHWTMSGGWWPTQGIAYRAPRDWLPRPRLRFDLLVDHLAQQLLGIRSTSLLLRACCEVTGLRPGTRVDASSGLVRWDFHRLLSTILDCPAHLSR
jgi:hypothetical protein